MPDETKRDRAPDELTDAQLLSWARKRGVVTFLIFCSIGLAVAVSWYFTR